VTTALSQLVPRVGIAPACAALGVNRATYYRRQHPRPERKPRPSPPRTLTTDEKVRVLEVLDSERFVDEPVRQVYAQLLDEQIYLCSPRTMYRILKEANQVCDRRRQRRHPTYVRPELVATKPNQVWSWDITKLPGPAAGLFFNLYVMLDIFSRYVVGWLVCLNGAMRGESYAIRIGRNVLGRDRRSDVVVSDDQASAHHADLVFRPEEKRFILMDHNSTNGTYVNEMEIEPRRDLAVKDVIRIGAQKFLFVPLIEDDFYWDDEGALK